MGSERSTGSDASTPAGIFEGLRPLFLQHKERCAQLREALVRCTVAGPEDPETLAAEEEAARLFDGLLDHTDHVLGESERRGLAPSAMEPLYAKAPELHPFNPVGVLVEVLFDGPRGEVLQKRLAAAATVRSAAGFLHGFFLEIQPDRPNAKAEVFALLETAAAAGHAPSQRKLARMLSNEPGDHAARVEALLQAAADGGSGGAANSLFHILGGENAPPDRRDRALNALRTATRLGHIEGRLALGYIAATGALGQEPDHARAKHLLASCARAHCLIAAQWLERYGDTPPERYQDALWKDGWLPDELPAPPPTGRLGLILSTAVMALLVFATLSGNSLGTWLLFVFVAILMHEAGHQFVGKWFGIPTAIFTVGIGPVVRSFSVASRPLPMRVDLRLFPLMGSVQPWVMPPSLWEYAKERERSRTAGIEPPPLPRFNAEEEPEPVTQLVPRSHRLAMLGGGLLVNLFAAVACLWIYEQASPAARLRTVPAAGAVAPGSVAARAGLLEGDRVLSVDGAPAEGFFDLQRRLAPRDGGGEATATADAPGTRIPLEVEREGKTLTLHWTVPTAPPSGNADAFWGLLPPETWVVASVHGEGGDLLPGDEILGFAPGSDPPPGDAPLRPADRARLRALFRPAPGGADPPPEFATVHVRREGEPRAVILRPIADEDGPVPGIVLARHREPGPAAGPGVVLQDVWRMGVRSVVELPGSIIRSFMEPPDREKQSWLHDAVAEDPWRVFHLFGFIHTFLLFLNLLPIPPLDGFQLLCTILEVIARRPLPKRGVQHAFRIGWILMGIWIAINAVLVLRDLAGSVL